MSLGNGAMLVGGWVPHKNTRNSREVPWLPGEREPALQVATKKYFNGDSYLTGYLLWLIPKMSNLGHTQVALWICSHHVQKLMQLLCIASISCRSMEFGIFQVTRYLLCRQRKNVLFH